MVYSSTKLIDDMGEYSPDDVHTYTHMDLLLR